MEDFVKLSRKCHKIFCIQWLIISFGLVRKEKYCWPLSQTSPSPSEKPLVVYHHDWNLVTVVWKALFWISLFHVVCYFSRLPQPMKATLVRTLRSAAALMLLSTKSQRPIQESHQAKSFYLKPQIIIFFAVKL